MRRRRACRPGHEVAEAGPRWAATRPVGRASWPPPRRAPPGPARPPTPRARPRPRACPAARAPGAPRRAAGRHPAPSTARSRQRLRDEMLDGLARRGGGQHAQQLAVAVDARGLVEEPPEAAVPAPPEA